VYTLENFPSLRTLLRETRAANPNTISMLTGDFLAPYLLSSIDQGFGMMRMCNAAPIDYLTWGNHEADIPHEARCSLRPPFLFFLCSALGSFGVTRSCHYLLIGVVSSNLP